LNQHVRGDKDLVRISQVVLDTGRVK